MLRTIGSASLILAAAPGGAHAHAGAPALPHDAWTAWSGEPVVLASLALVAFGYLRGTRAIRERAGPGRGISRWRQGCHWGGWVALVIALVSPVDAIGEALFSAHMVQHLLLTMVAAPLLVLGDTGTALLWALPLRGRRRVGDVVASRAARATWRFVAAPVNAWAMHTTAIVAWHTPWLYELAVRDDAVHAMEHASFLATALVYWWAVAAPLVRHRLTFGAALLYLFAGVLASTIIGAFITMSATPWYLVHARTAVAWGLTPLEDQQLAGAIMWVPAGVIYLVALVPLCVEALSERRPRRAHGA